MDQFILSLSLSLLPSPLSAKVLLLPKLFDLGKREKKGNSLAIFLKVKKKGGWGSFPLVLSYLSRSCSTSPSHVLLHA